MIATQIPIGLGAFLWMRTSESRQATLPRIVAACGGLGRPVVVREDFIWSTIEPSASGAYSWTAYDSVVTDCAYAGVRIFAIACKPPAWAVGGNTTDDAWPCVPTSAIPTRGGTSDAQADYAAFCAAIAARYGPAGDFWRAHPTLPAYPIIQIEVWNEPYVGGSWKQWNGSAAVTTNSTPTSYAAMFSAAAAAIHAANPYCRAFASVATSTTNNGIPYTSYLIPFLEAVTVDPDGLSVHPYTHNYYPASADLVYGRAPYDKEWARSYRYFGQVDDARAICNGFGLPDMPIWVTEIGWPTHLTGTTVVLGASQAEAEARQAARIVDLFEHLRRRDYILDGLILYAFNNPWAPDQPGQAGYDEGGPEHFYGLWHTDGAGGVYDGGTCTAKPAVAALTTQSALGIPDAGRNQ